MTRTELDPMDMPLTLDAPGTIIDACNGVEGRPGRLGDDVLARVPVLRDLGAGPGKTLALFHGNSAAFFADLLAAWRVGACVACLNPGLAAEEFRNVVQYVDAMAVLLAEGESLPDGFPIPSLTLAGHSGGNPRSGPDGAGASPDDNALILFTSGTTGAPKGVVHTFRSLKARLSLNRAFIGDADLETTLCTLPTHFGHGLIGNCLTPLSAGKRLILTGLDTMRLAADIGGIIDRHGVTFLSSVPAFWKLALKLGKPPRGGSLKRIHVGSAPLSADLWTSIIDWSGGAEVVNMYGITETANWLAGASSAKFKPRDGLIGRMIGGVAAVRTGDGSIEQTGEGEIVVRTPSLMAGYFRQPELTGSVIRDGWYHTGDKGVVDKRGCIRLTGRLRTEINRGGVKISPEEVDMLLERHRDVAEACAFGMPDPVAGETVAAAVRLRPGAMTGTEDLRAWCLERIRRECVPERWFVVAEIPKTDRGKLNRAAVREACLARRDD